MASIIHFTPAYILWLIRNKTANTFEEILKHFNLDPLHADSLLYAVGDQIKELILKNLISVENNLNMEEVDTVYKFVYDPYLSDLSRAYFSITENTLNVLTTLDISLKEVANREYNSIFVNPIFNTRNTTRKGYNLFVLMPFITDLKPVYDDHIKNVAEELKMSVARADDFFTTNSIVDEVWQTIYESKIIIADCSGKNPNVFYEIGIAHTIGKPVILITNNRSDIPFDLSHIRYIVYDFTPRGMKEFEKALRITINEITSI